MASRRKKTDAACCGPKEPSGATSACRVEALVAVDARGQFVLPKDLREKAGIGAGDKLAVISFESDGQVCCITLIKADVLADTVKSTLGPVMGILQD